MEMVSVNNDTDRHRYLHISVTKTFPVAGRSRIAEIYGHDRGLVNLAASCGDNGKLYSRTDRTYAE